MVIGVKDRYGVVRRFMSQHHHKSTISIASWIFRIRFPAIGHQPVLLVLREVLAIPREDIVAGFEDMVCEHLQAGLLGDSIYSSFSRRNEYQIRLRVSGK